MQKLDTKTIKALDKHLRQKLVPAAEAAIKRVKMPKKTGSLQNSIKFDLKIKDANSGIWEVSLKMHRYGFYLDNQARSRQYKRNSLRKLKSDSKLVKNKELYTNILREFFLLQLFIEKEIANFLGVEIDAELQKMLDTL